MNNFRSKLFYIIILITILSACQASREIKRQTEYIRRPEALIDASSTRGLNYKQVSLKASITVTQGKEKFSFKATIRMDKDSAVWTTITFFGIAGAKVLITQDSIKLVNYKDRNFISEDFIIVQDFLKTNLLTLGNLQALLMGELPELDNFDKLKLKLEENKYHLTTISERRLEKDWIEKKLNKIERKIEKQELDQDEKGQERMEKKQEKNVEKYKNMAVEVWVDPYNLKVENILVKDYEYDAEMSVTYGEFEEISTGRVVPHKIGIQVNEKNQLNIDIVYSKINFDETLEMPFSVPKTYERVKM